MAAKSDRKAPGPRGHFLVGNPGEFRRDVLGLILRSTAADGDIVRCRLGPQVIHLPNHPDHAEQVLQKRAANYDKNTRSSAFIRSAAGESLLTGNGEAWKRERRMVQPAFHHQQIAGFAGRMGAAAESMLAGWRGKELIDISAEMTRLTYIVGQTLFSFNPGKEAATIETAMPSILPHVFNRLGQIINWPIWLPTPANRRFHRSLAEVDRIVYQVIRGHRLAQQNGEPDQDLLPCCCACARKRKTRWATCNCGMKPSRFCWPDTKPPPTP